MPEPFEIEQSEFDGGDRIYQRVYFEAEPGNYATSEFTIQMIGDGDTLEEAYESLSSDIEQTIGDMEEVIARLRITQARCDQMAEGKPWPDPPRWMPGEGGEWHLGGIDTDGTPFYLWHTDADLRAAAEPEDE